MRSLSILLILFTLTIKLTAQPRLIPYRVGDKWGLANNEKVLIVPVIYDTLELTKALILWAKKGKRYAYISSTGDILSKPKHKYPSYKLSKKYLKKYNKRHNISNKKRPAIYKCGGGILHHSYLLEMKIDTKYAITSSYYHFEKEHKSALENFIPGDQLEELPVIYQKPHVLFSKMRFDSVIGITTTLNANNKETKSAFVKKDSLWGVIDMYGVMYSDFRFSEIKFNRKIGNEPPILVKFNEKWAFVDEFGAFISQKTYLKAEPFRYSSFTKVWTTPELWGYINKKGVEFFED